MLTQVYAVRRSVIAGITKSVPKQVITFRVKIDCDAQTT